jgi:hypothetical protein
MKYERPNVVVAGSAVAAIQTPDPSPKFTSNIQDSGGQDPGYHTLNAYAADE